MDTTIKKIIAIIVAAFAIGALPAMALLTPLILLLNSDARQSLYDHLEGLKIENGGNSKFVEFLEKIQNQL
ncbi:MAG: hypothetical protein H6565_11690 [Lewinellaceae bacterium]|nr:hypothetical protein [Lewinellaceae bacterium]